MKMLTRLLIASTLTIPTAANAAVIYLDFEDIASYPNNSDVLIQDYYSGGAASNGNVGPDYGVAFTSDAFLLCLNTASSFCSNTSRGGQGISSSQFGALYFPSANPIMNVAAGFDTGFAGVFSAPFTPNTTVSIYDGLNGTGNQLASLVLGTTGGGCDNSISGGASYCPFVDFSLSFAGVAQSVVFGGTVNQQVFDDLTFGSTVAGGGAVPEPTTWAMMLLGFGVIGGAMRHKRKPAEGNLALR